MQVYRTIIFTITLALAGCSSGPVVTVNNQSSITLSNIVVSGSDFTNSIENLVPGSQRKLIVHPRGESGLRLIFDAAGKHVDSGEQGYFEGGNDYRVAVTINTNLSVSMSSDIRTY